MPHEFEREEPTGNLDGIDADALLSDIESGGNREIPMEHTKEAQPTQTTGAPAPTLSEIEFDYLDKKIKVPYTDPRVKTWAAQGYDYSQKMAQFNQRQQEFEKTYSPYKMIDDFAKQNPDWWKHVEGSYQARTQNGGNQKSESASPELESLKKELQDLKQFKTALEEKQTAERIKTEDQDLDQEIKSIREKYKDLDWNTPDQNGQSLEQRIVKHAIDNKIQSFRAAFRDYNHDNLLKLAQESGKETQTKELQKRTKLGIIGQSPTPKKGIQAAEGVKNKSYNELLSEAREELGIA